MRRAGGDTKSSLNKRFLSSFFVKQELQNPVNALNVLQSTSKHIFAEFERAVRAYPSKHEEHTI